MRRPKNSPDKKRYMGRSMVTQRYHYVEWRPWDHAKKSAGALAARELYDLSVDPEENVNLAGREDRQVEVRTLADRLAAGWRAAVPK